MARSRECFAHTHRELVPVERHHVWPLGYHGPNVAANLETVCANAHSDTHYLLEHMLRGHEVDLREYGPGIRTLARRGYEAVMAYAEHAAQLAERGVVIPTCVHADGTEHPAEVDADGFASLPCDRPAP